jgi:branched-chain amino acid transport system permease protein
MEYVIEVLISGILVGMSYAVIAVGLTLILGVLNIINFAHTSFAVLAMYIPTYTLYQRWGVDPFISAVIAVPMFFILGYIIQRVLLERATGENASEMSTLIITMGLSLLINNLILVIWKGAPRIINEPYTTGTWSFGNVLLNHAQTYSFFISCLIIIGMFIFLNRTMLGLGIKAAADNPQSCAYMGINLRFMYGIAFAIGIATTAAGGSLMATYRSFNPFYGDSIVVIIFACVILGGMGSILGAVIGAIIIGIVQQVSATLFTISIQNVAIFVIFVIVLYFRPQGILGKKERII